jgi:hypothetical protein
MSKPFKTLVARMTPDAQERVTARTREMLLEMNLRDLSAQLTHAAYDTPSPPAEKGIGDEVQERNKTR